jgi:tetratricopeptide (TPR) repeat protein
MRQLKTAGACVILVALTLIAYAPVWKNGLVDFDDELYISDNPQVMHGLSRSGLGWAFTNYYGNYWQPLAWVSLQLDLQLFTGRTRDGQPNSATIAAIHAHNLFWHCGSALLLFGLLHRMTGATFSSFFVAGLFALHPMHVESVAWAAERKDVLSVFFGIVTLWAYVWYAAKPNLIRYLATALAYALSLMCKPMLITLPFVLLLLDYWPLNRMFAAKDLSQSAGTLEPVALSFRHLLLEKVPFLLLAVASGIFTLLARRQAGAIVSLDVIPLSARLGTAATAYGWYFWHTLWPAQLAALYPHPGRNWAVVPAVAGLAVLTFISALAIWQVRQRRWLFVGWFWFVGTLFPVIGLAQGGEQAWADRFCYWPHIGFFMVIVWGISELVERWHIPAWLPGTIALGLLGCLVNLTRIQVGYWRDTPTLWKRALAVTTDNDVAHLHLGGYFNSILGFEKAEQHFAEAVRLQPENGVFRNYLGETLLRQGKVEQATTHLEKAVKLLPDFLPAWRSLGMARMRLNQPKDAVVCFQEVVRLKPDSAEALTALGWVQWQSGLRSDANSSFQSALRLEPELADRFASQAMQLATDSDANRREPQLAFELASLAVASSADPPAAALDALAAAHAALGQFTEATKTAKLALAKADLTNETLLSRSIAERLHLYERQTAFIQPPKPKAPTP